MIKQITISILFLCTLISNAQEELAHFKVGMKKSNSFIKDALPIHDESNDMVSLFIMDSKNVYAYLFTPDFKISDSLQLEKKSRKYESIIGSGISGTNDQKEYNLYVTNNFEDQFAVVNFSYEKDSSYLKEFELDLKNEVFVQTFNYNQKLYILSVPKKSSVINVYELDSDGTNTMHNIDCSDIVFLNYKGKETTLYEMIIPDNSILKGGPIISSSKKIADVVKIENDILHPIDLTSGLSKLYLKNNKVILTLDENENLTQLLSIDLNTFQYESAQYKKPFFDIEKNKKKVNTFVFDDKLFTIATTKEAFKFTIRDLMNSSILAEFDTHKKDTIDFKNSPIIQIGGAYARYREFEETPKFFRKVYDGDVGVSVYKPGNNYEVLLGGKVEYRATSAGMGLGGPSIPIASMGAVTIYFNVAFFAYEAYTYTKSTYVKCLFDENFNHVEGTFPQHAYDKMKEFKEEKETTSDAKTVFKYKGFYILGTYTPWPYQQYRLRRFKD